MALLACLIVAACGSEQRPPPAGDPFPPAASQAASVTSYSVRPGDTLGAVSQRLQVPVAELIAINRLRPPYSLIPGQHLAIPERGGAAPRTHVVQAGDTVAGLATRFQVPIRSLIEMNGLVPPYPLAPGRALIIPPPRQHVVRSGDTVYNISRRYGVDQSSLVAVNRIPPPYTIYLGQRLQLPAAVQTAATTPALAVAPAASTAARPVATVAEGITSEELPPAAPAAGAPSAGSTLPGVPPPVPGLPAGSASGSTPAAGAPSAGSTLPGVPPPVPGLPAGSASGSTPAAAAPSVPEIAAVPQPAPRSGGKFLWPVSGKIVARFGTMRDGLHNDGINIAAPRGTPVRATENGVVAYSGNELRGFGNLLLIRHADGWISAYAHNEALLVKRGDQVRRGQTIAHVGSTGNVPSPQLHFELRRGADAVDPLSVLGSQNAAVSPAAAAGVLPDPG